MSTKTYEQVYYKPWEYYDDEEYEYAADTWSDKYGGVKKENNSYLFQGDYGEDDYRGPDDGGDEDGGYDADEWSDKKQKTERGAKRRKRKRDGELKYEFEPKRETEVQEQPAPQGGHWSNLPFSAREAGVKISSFRNVPKKKQKVKRPRKKRWKKKVSKKKTSIRQKKPKGWWKKTR